MGRRQPLEAVEQLRAQLMQARERQLLLRFDPNRADELTAVSGPGGVVQERGLAGSRGTAQHQDPTLSGPRIIEQAIELRTLQAASDQHQGPEAKLPAGDHRDHPHVARIRNGALHTSLVAMVGPVDVDVYMPVQLASLIEEQVGDGELAECLADGLRLNVEATPALRLRREHARNSYTDHSVTSTERIGGRCRTPSTHVSPSVRAKNEPLCVPK